MSLNYPPQNLTVYVSDDGCSEITFYALLEASEFCKHWIPFCKKYNVEPRAPDIYFAHNTDSCGSEWTTIKNMYDDMKIRIDSAVAKGCVPKNHHKGFSEWSSCVTKQDHHSIVQILIQGWNPDVGDAEGNRLPTLVYLSREKKPGCPHNFKAGSMNSLIRVSSEISNAPIILNLDCDMYSNDPDAIQDALCFFLDEEQGKQISYVQYPQRFSNITMNDIYANAASTAFQIELAGIDGLGGALFIGTGCFHRRESLSGMKYLKDQKLDFNDKTKCRTVEELELASRPLANCSYEKDTLWGKEMGLVYGSPVEDIVTGLTIQCKGWKPVYYNPSKNAFQGLAPTSLDKTLVQIKRWSEGWFQILFSKYCPFVYGRGKISLGAQIGYCSCILWAPVSLPMLCYAVIPAFYLLHDVTLFPQVSSLWFLPFVYAYGARTIYSMGEGLMCGDSLRSWWNLQRMTFIRRIAPFLFASIDTVWKLLGVSETSFAITDKAIDEEVQKRYENEIMEFGSSSTMFTMVATVALLNLVSLGYGIKKVMFSAPETLAMLLPQMIICGLIVLVNSPVYEALLIRSDKGSIPASVLLKATVLVSAACVAPMY